MNHSVSLLPDLQSSLLCDDVRQEVNGKFILIGLFHAIGSNQFPLRYPRLCVVNRWCSGEGTFTQTTRILKPDRSTPLLTGKNLPVQLQDQASTVTNVELFLNVNFEEPGVYWFEILLENQLKLSYPLRVAKVASNAADGTQQPPPPTQG